MKNGKALEKFKEFLENQGGDGSIVDQPEKLPQAPYQIEVPAKESGVIAEIVADEIGVAAMILGAGRATKKTISIYLLASCSTKSRRSCRKRRIS